jgi:rubrerythrin
MNLRGSETEKNLLKAFAGESQARNKYSYFSSVARDEKYEQISGIFQETADNEKEHAKIFFKHLQKSGGVPVEIIAEYPAGKIGTTEENLFAAAEGEKLEWGKLYPNFAEIANKEGFKDIADSFKQIGEVEEKHEARYRKLLENLKEKKVFKREEVVRWKCRNCGYVHEGKEAPKVCPACKHPQAFYELMAENY